MEIASYSIGEISSASRLFLAKFWMFLINSHLAFNKFFSLSLNLITPDFVLIRWTVDSIKAFSKFFFLHLLLTQFSFQTLNLRNNMKF